MPEPAGVTQIPVVCDQTVYSGTIVLDMRRSDDTVISAVKPTGYGTATDVLVAYIDVGGSISFTTSAKPGAAKLTVSLWYDDGTTALGAENLDPEQLFEVPEHVIQIGLYYA